MRKLVLILALLLPRDGSAHPHIFVDAGLELIFDAQGHLSQVRVTWVYDEFYSLLITEDHKMDNDFDGNLTTSEAAVLAGFDTNWVEGYNGDLVITLDGKALTLSGPAEPTASMTGGKITTTHLRQVTERPKVVGSISAKMFDPTHYSAYDVTRPVTVRGRDACVLEKKEPDLDVEMQRLQQRLAKMAPDVNPEDTGFPDVGDAFATEILVTCPGF